MADRVRRPLCAWSLADRMCPTRPTLVTCTLVVRWSASSLRHSPPVRASTLDHRTQPSRLGAQREGTRSSNHHGAAAITKPEELDTTKRPSTHPQKTTKLPRRHTRSSRPVRPFITPFQRLAPPRFLLRPPSSSCEKLREKGRSLVPSASFHERPMANDLHRPSPTPKRGENRWEY